MRLSLFLLLLVMGGVFAAPAIAAADAAQKEDRFHFLARFFDLNETAFAYHRHCISKDRLPDPVFMENLDYVANALMQEMVSEFPDKKPAQHRANIMGRRYMIQQRLDGFYYENKCDSDHALTSAAHYEQFRAIDSVAVQKFILEKTGG
jgi:hypothetical protein